MNANRFKVKLPVGAQIYRVGPVYNLEVHGDRVLEYEVDDMADWERRRAEALKADPGM